MRLLPTRIYLDSLWPLAAVIAIPLACLPARAPTVTEATIAVTEATIAALNATDVALEVAVENAPPGDATVDGYIRVWERAADAVRNKQDFCPHAAGLEVVAAAIKCSKCTTLLDAAAKELRCPKS